MVSLNQVFLVGNLTKDPEMRYTPQGAAVVTLRIAVNTAFKDKNGQHPVFTPVSLVANPDFEKIKAYDFERYHFEPFTRTLDRFEREDAFILWKEGIEKRLFVPQFHGREHLNVQVWMRKLRGNDPHTRLAFEHGFWGYTNAHPAGISYQAAFDLELPADMEYQKEVISTGLDLFESLHGYKASYFVPPNGPFNETLEKTAAEKGIQFMSASKIHREPQGNGKFKKKLHYLGQRNRL